MPALPVCLFVQHPFKQLPVEGLPLHTTGRGYGARRVRWRVGWAVLAIQISVLACYSLLVVL